MVPYPELRLSRLNSTDPTGVTQDSVASGVESS